MTFQRYQRVASEWQWPAPSARVASAQCPVGLRMSSLSKWSLNCTQDILHSSRLCYWSQGPGVAEGKSYTAKTETMKGLSTLAFPCCFSLGPFPIQQQGCIYLTLPSFATDVPVEALLVYHIPCQTQLQVCFRLSMKCHLYKTENMSVSTKLHFQGKYSIGNAGCKYISNYILASTFWPWDQSDKPTCFGFICTIKFLQNRWPYVWSKNSIGITPKMTGNCSWWR